MDLATREGVEAFIANDLVYIRERFDEVKGWMAMAVVLASTHPETGEAFPAVTPMPVLIPALPPGEKDGIVAAVSGLARAGHAIGISFAAESWMLLGYDPANKPKGSFEHVPGRKEILCYSMEHLRLPSPRLYWAEIHRHALGVTLGPWTNPAEGRTDAVHKGRFTDLLDRTRFA